MVKIGDFLGKSVVENIQTTIEKVKADADCSELVSLMEESALEQATDVDGKSGKLAGVPFVVDDGFLTLEASTNRLLGDFQSPIQATAIDKLELEGAVCIGKMSLHNLTDNKKLKTLLAVVPFILKVDSDGSIRRLASSSGTVGFKPTYGAVSRYGVVAKVSSTDTVSCLTNSIEDTSLVIEALAGQDPKDATTLPDFWSKKPSSPIKKVGIVKQFVNGNIDSETSTEALDCANHLKKLGYSVSEVDLSMAKYAQAIYRVVSSAEVSSNLARYDGIRYGHRSQTAKTLDDLYGQNRRDIFTLEDIRQIMFGNLVLSSGYYDEYYLRAQKVRTLLIDEFKKLFQEYDVLMMNGSDEADSNGAMVTSTSLAGLPVVSLPTGVQLVGNYQSDRALLELAQKVEEAKL